MASSRGKYVGYHKGLFVYPYYAVDVPGVLSQASDHGTCLAFVVGKPAGTLPLVPDRTVPSR